MNKCNYTILNNYKSDNLFIQVKLLLYYYSYMNKCFYTITSINYTYFLYVNAQTN